MTRKQLYLIIFVALALDANTQDPGRGITARMGMSSTYITFKEAYSPPRDVFGTEFNFRKTFFGEGYEFGVAWDYSENLFIDLGYSIFKGEEQTLETNTLTYSYQLRGYYVPLTINYLLRNTERKLRINAGAGINFLRALANQFEVINDNGRTGPPVTREIRNITINEFFLLLRPGLQYRIFDDCYVSFTSNLGLSTSLRFSHHPCLSTRYTFPLKKK